MKVKNGDKAALKWVYAKSKKQHIRLMILIIGNALYASMSVLFALMCRGIIDGATDGMRDRIISSVIGLLLVIGAMLILRLFCNSLNERIRAELENDMSTTDSSTVVIENENTDGGLVDDAGEDYQNMVIKTESSQPKRLRANYLQ